MAKRFVSKRKHVEALIEAMAPAISKAFLAAFADVVDGAQILHIEKALMNADLDGALDAVQMSPASFNNYVKMIEQSYVSAGELVVAQAPKTLKEPITGMRLVIRFDARNPSAEQYLRTTSSGKVTHIILQQKDDLRQSLAAGLGRGDNPRSIALDLVGRINPATGRRAGGIVGLSKPQMDWVANARAELRSGDPAKLANYLQRTLRDRRFDSTIQKAIAEGSPVPEAQLNQIAGRYADRLLKLRGDTIARTEALTSLAEGQREAYRQIVKTGAISADAIKRVWLTAGDGRVRDSHISMNGQTVGLDEPFVSGDGNLLMYPMDENAPPEEVINCRCTLADDIDYFAGVA